MGDIDQGIKRLLQLRPQDFLQLAFPDASPEYLGPVEADVAMEPQLIADNLQRARLYAQPCIVDIEVQAYPDLDMARRMFKYGVRADILYNLPVLSVVLILQPGGTIPQPPYARGIGPIPILTWHFHNVEVYNLKGRDIIDAGMISLMPLIPFMADRSLEVVEEAAGLIKERVAEAEQVETFESLLAIFGSKFFGEDTMLALMRRLNMSIDTWKEFPLMRTWLEQAEAEGRAKGEAEGRAKGEAEGRAEGRAEGETEALRRSVRRIIEKRFGSLDPALAAAIDNADAKTLDAIEADAITEPIETIRARLVQPENSPSEQPQQ